MVYIKSFTITNIYWDEFEVVMSRIFWYGIYVQFIDGFILRELCYVC